MPDLITIGETMAVMAPRESGPLRYVTDYRLRMAGAESNLAIGIAKLGRSAAWISRLGTDEMGDFVLNAIRAEGVDCSCVRRDPEHRTGLMLKELSAGETRVYYYRENSAASHLSPADLSETTFRSARILHLTGITPVLSESCEKTVLAAAELAHRLGLPVSFDPNIRRKLWKNRDYTPLMRALLLSSQIAMLGLDEAETLLGTSNVETIVTTLLRAGVSWIAVKDGAKGAYVANRERICFIPPYPCKAIDPVGAGDAFNAGFLTGILEGRDPETCGRMGGIAGAMATQNTGDIEGIPSRAQLEGKLASQKEIYR